MLDYLVDVYKNVKISNTMVDKAIIEYKHLSKSEQNKRKYKAFIKRFKKSNPECFL